MGFYEEIEQRYKGAFKAIEDDDERCCEHPTCWVGILWDLMQAAAKVKIQEIYIAKLEANASAVTL